MQVNSLRAAVSPAKRHSLGGSGSPRTERNGEDKENEEDIGLGGGNAVTPIKRVPILANFEEWMKMATDNKINATNSWNFALIDYFHDMSLLREGDSVNFQKASCTLDGCVKIYTSRVDSVATETGKLLSGLADSNSKKTSRDEAEDAEGDDEDEEGEDGQKKPKKKRVKTAEATLAPSFAQLQLKKMDLEFSVDPLFKKATADFDEGGAKGLLLNHLTIDGNGRIVFDSSEDAEATRSEGGADDVCGDDKASKEDPMDVGEQQVEEAEAQPSVTPSKHQAPPPIDLDNLASRFFPDLSKLEAQDICPSLKTYELGGADTSLDIPFLKDDDWKRDDENLDQQKDKVETSSSADIDDGDEGGFGSFDVVADVGFGEGGEAWVKETALESQPRPFDSGLDTSVDDGGDGGDEGYVGGYHPDGTQYGLTLGKSSHEAPNILTYFDNALQKNWAGPQHWRIQKIKDANTAKTPGPSRQRKEKEPFSIDFNAPMTSELASALYTPASSNSSIQLPRSQWKTRTRNLLPDDKHFNSKQLLRLFLKPKARIGARRLGGSRSTLSKPNEEPQQTDMDPAFWARRAEEAAAEDAAGLDQNGPMQGDYNANFFQDDGLGALPGGMDDEDDDVFADARDHFSPGVEGFPDGQVQGLDAMLAPESQTPEGGFGSQLVTSSRRVRPEYVQYARVAKKVDVRRLKEEIWKGLGYEKDDMSKNSPYKTQTLAPLHPQEDGSLRFTDAMKGLQAVYPEQQMADISTSYCFICLLHLANEKGLALQHESDWEEIRIRKDENAEIMEEG
ncbi:MAG: hypothetical protein Q9162_005329 [Coniocarpon cinnabarinum]